VRNKIGTWNVRFPYAAGKLANAVNVVLGTHITGAQIHHRKDPGEKEETFVAPQHQELLRHPRRCHFIQTCRSAHDSHCAINTCLHATLSVWHYKEKKITQSRTRLKTSRIRYVAITNIIIFLGNFSFTSHLRCLANPCTRDITITRTTKHSLLLCDLRRR